ncbi:Hsp70 family protein [Actinoplanes sp. CA-252034]|uniref:Hsp70 family protein n=1 Tax=Actinoplanes sp. CA-252034 TaxID=3239906 RepID=UPI003D982BFE
MYALGIDLGTTYTAAAVWRDGHVEIATLGSRTAAIPSVVLLRDDETMLTGEIAGRRGLTEPHRVAREFKRRLGDPVPILLGGVPYSAEALMARMLRAVVDEVVKREGAEPSRICVSHPANWGPFKIDLMYQVIRLAGIEQPVQLVTEPQAAAVFYARQQRLEPGATVAVYDLGGGTFDAAVLRKTVGGFELIGRPEGIERLGGVDFDAAVFAHVSGALGGALESLDEDDPAVVSAVARLREECVQAKEALSADTDATIPVLLPELTTEVRITRAELESMVRPVLHGPIEVLRRTIRSAGIEPADLHAVLLVGGSSRIPLVAQMVESELGRPVAVDAHPKHAVALGAAWQAGAEISEAGTALVLPAAVDPWATGEAAAVAGAWPPSVAPAISASSGVPDVTASGDAAPDPTGGRAAEPHPAGAGVPGPDQAGPGLVVPDRAGPGSVVPGQAGPGSVVPGQAGPGSVVPNQAGPGLVAPDPGVDVRALSGAIPAGAAGGVGASGGVGAAAGGGDATGGAGTTGARVPAGTPGRSLGTIMVAALVVVMMAGVAGTAWALGRLSDDEKKDPETPSAAGASPHSMSHSPGPAGAGGTPSAAASTPAAASPADEVCTDQMKQSPRWVCLTRATIRDGRFTLWYEAEWNGEDPDTVEGFHLHVYGGDGQSPKESTMGSQATAHGKYYYEDREPSVRRVTDQDFEAVGAATKVCARIARSGHGLALAADGSYHTGNCIPIVRE